MDDETWHKQSKFIYDQAKPFVPQRIPYIEDWSTNQIRVVLRLPLDWFEIAEVFYQTDLSSKMTEQTMRRTLKKMFHQDMLEPFETRSDHQSVHMYRLRLTAEGLRFKVHILMRALEDEVLILT